MVPGPGQCLRLAHLPGPPAQWRSFSRDAIPAWSRLYNRLHPGVDIYSVHFAKKLPWCQNLGHGNRTDCQLPDGSEVSLAVMLPDSLGGSVKYIKGFAFEIRTSFPQDLAAPKQAYVRNMQVVVSHEQRDYRNSAPSNPLSMALACGTMCLVCTRIAFPPSLGWPLGTPREATCLLASNMLGLLVTWNRPSTCLPAASARLMALGGSALITWYGPSSPHRMGDLGDPY